MANAVQTPALGQPNSLKVALATKRRQIGSWSAIGDPYLAEMNVTTGFDWLLIGSGHASNDVRMILTQLQAMASYRAEPIMWPYSDDPTLIKRLLDTGARTLLMPMVDTAEQAHDLMHAVRYPPFGIRDVGSAIGHTSCWNARTDYLQVADNEAYLLMQIEAAIVLQNLEVICAVGGANGVFIDPADLAAPVGYRDNAGHPEVQTVVDNAIRTITAPDKTAGTLTSDPVLARHYLESDCTFVATGIDILLFANDARKFTRDLIAP